ncbi:MULTISPECIES: hypothetical protein [unclassified Spirosoma]|uniref:hypothetical protein n=1 Tax=unclassified Spirosoma TaxID=2621999 RepID=UPI001ACEDC64|nr:MULTISPECIES: hypothetical protein [unclassified Spirosoma]MBN8821313.1 hypothetical protein [Spirosoma sp.]
MKRFLGDLLYDNLVIALCMAGFLLMLHCYLVRHYRTINSHHASAPFPYHSR